MSEPRRRGTLHCKNPDQLLDGIEILDTDPADWDELIAAASGVIDFEDRNDSGELVTMQQFSDGKHSAIDRLRKALEPK